MPPATVSRRLAPLQAATLSLTLLTGCYHTLQEGPRPLPRAEQQAVVSDLSGRRFFALIINGDTEERHLNNVAQAKEALKANSIPDARIIVASPPLGNASPSSLRTIAAGLSGMMGKGDGLLVYVTGHGAPEGIVLGGGEVLPHPDFIAMMKPLRAFRTLFIFDSCFSGALPGRLVEAGFDCTAMAPVAEGSESQCQLFSPYLWSAMKSGMDSNGDGKTTMEEVFRSAMDVYNTKRAAAGMRPVFGVFDRPVPPIRSLEQIKSGNVIVELSANWCGPCKMQRQELNNLRSLFGERLNVLTLDVESNPVMKDFGKAAGREIGGGVPQLFFFKDGKLVHWRQGLAAAASLASDSISVFGIPKETNRVLVRGLERNLRGNDRALAMGSATALLGLGVVSDAVASYFRRQLKEGSEADIAGMVVEASALPGYTKLAQRLGPEWVAEAEGAIQNIFRKKIRSHVELISQGGPHLGNFLRNVGLDLRAAQGMPRHIGDTYKPKGELIPGIRLYVLREEMQPFFARQLNTPQSWEMFEYAIEMAGIVSSYESVRRLEEIATSEKSFDPAYRADAILALGDIADSSSLPILLKLAGSKEEKIAGSAIRALSRFTERGSPRVLNSVSQSEAAIMKALGHKSPLVRAAALLSLGDIGDRIFVPFIGRLNKDKDARVQLCMIAALAQCGGPEAVRILTEIARTTPEAGLRLQAEDALRALSE